MHGLTAHIIDAPASAPVGWASLALAVAVSLFGLGLAVQHHLVKHDGVNRLALRRSATIAAIATLLATMAPAPASGLQPTVPTGLPDLTSLPPLIWFDRFIELADGSEARVLAFDGYLMNVGDGVLDLYGNPQEPDGVKQRWFDGDEWIEVATPRVIYETTDDHNHFHLMAAAEYELWDEGRTTKVGDSAKVGFCLLDTERVEDRFEQLYAIGELNYCEQDNPDAELLHMGITPGWVDTYDASTTLQWVDVSNTRPGRYWVAAITDPEDQIVESDESNNGHVFSQNRFAVSGYEARAARVVASDDPIVLRADVYGDVGEPRWRVIDGPEHGVLSRPVGFDFAEPQLGYTAEAGFEGTDSFTVQVRDANRPFPLEPTVVTIEVEVGADASTTGWVPTLEAIPATDGVFTLVPDLENLATLVEVDASFEAVVGREIADWFARDLPPGLSIDRATGALSGVPTVPQTGTAVVAARPVDSAELLTIEVPWQVSETTIDIRAALDDLHDLSSPRGERVRLVIGAGSPGAAYEATGLPPGVEMVTNTPWLTGEATESGVFDVEVTETIDGEVTATASFVWTIRLAARPEFPL